MPLSDEPEFSDLGEESPLAPRPPHTGWQLKAATIVIGLLLFIGPPLDGVAGYLLFVRGHPNVGAAVLLINAVMVGGTLISILPEWLRPAGFAPALARVIVNYNINVWLGLLALVYSAVVAAWLRAVILLVGIALPEVGGRGIGWWVRRDTVDPRGPKGK